MQPWFFSLEHAFPDSQSLNFRVFYHLESMRISETIKPVPLKKKMFIYLLFLAALGLCCCAQAFSSCGEQGLLFVAMRGLPIAVASLVAEHGLQACGLQ